MSHFDPFESQCVRFTKARLAPLRTQKSSGNEAFALRLTTLNARQARYATVCSTLTLLQLEQIAFSIWTVLTIAASAITSMLRAQGSRLARDVVTRDAEFYRPMDK